MTDEENVKMIYPDAKCRPDIFGIQWEIHTETPKTNWFGRPRTLLGSSTVSIEESWKYAWLDIQEKLLKKLES